MTERRTDTKDAERRGRETARMRRYRRRQRRGELVVPVIVSLDVVGVLLALGWLPEADSEDRSHIGDAVARMLAELAAHHKS